MSITPLRQQPSWKALEQHHAEIGTVHLRARGPAHAEGDSSTNLSSVVTAP